jgi:hypothetical protein
MQRSGQTVLSHFFRLQVGEGRVQLLEGIEVFEDRFHQRVNSVFRHVRRGDEGRAHTEGLVSLSLPRYMPPGMVAVR